MSLIIGALRRASTGWGKVHGSNYARAMRCGALSPSAANDLQVGWAAYKFHPPGHARNKLPSGYANHPDQRDYYHVGVVESVNPLRILHCTSWRGGSGVKVDTRLGAWAVGGPLSRVSDAVAAPHVPPTDYKAPVISQPTQAAVRTLRVIKGVPLMRGETCAPFSGGFGAWIFGRSPKGADGIYGWDTCRAVMAFQIDAFPPAPPTGTAWLARTREKLGVIA